LWNIHYAFRMPRQIGNWIVGEQLGGGGQGHVFRARRVGEDGEEFALKRLHRAGSTKARERFTREIEALRRISHPAVVRPIDHSSPADEQPFYVMPYEPGVKKLADTIWSSDRVPPFRHNVRRSLEFIAQCADAVAAAHAERVVHRDLKPDNILVRADGTPLIIDFGCCLLLDDEGVLTLTDEGVGARNFMAPECEAGVEGQTGPATDVYSLGKILWCMVSGERPFARERPGFINKLMTNMMPNKPLAGFVVDIMLRSVRADKSKRVADASAFSEMCAGVLAQIEAGGFHRSFIAPRCHVCWATNAKESATKIGDPYPLTAFSLLGNTGLENQDLTVKACVECGTVTTYDKRPYLAYKQRVEEAER
jgi:eukaryotic-like serine/threonine-protein kinase